MAQGMKLECVLTAVDMKPFYLDFVPVFIEAWRRTYPQVDVRIVLVADEVPDDLKQYGDRIILFKPLKGVQTGFTAQCVRLLYPGLLGYEGGVMISDIDTIPLNSTYHLESVENAPSDAFICTSGLAELDVKQIHMMYNIAASKTWRGMFGVGTVEEARQRLKDMYDNRYKASREIAKLIRAKHLKRYSRRKRLRLCLGAFKNSTVLWAKMILRELPRARSIADVKAMRLPPPLGAAWYMDQHELYLRAMDWNKAGGKLVLLRREFTDPELLNRRRSFKTLGLKVFGRFTEFNAPNFEFAEVKDQITAGDYFHLSCPRPYRRYKELIDAVVELL